MVYSVPSQIIVNLSGIVDFASYVIPDIPVLEPNSMVKVCLPITPPFWLNAHGTLGGSGGSGGFGGVRSVTVVFVPVIVLLIVEVVTASISKTGSIETVATLVETIVLSVDCDRPCATYFVAAAVVVPD